MKKSEYKVLSNVCIAERTWMLKLEGDTSGCERGGQFADVALPGRFLRRPLAVTEWNGTSMTLIYKVVGSGTDELSRICPGSMLDVLTGLGNGFDASRTLSSALVVCGGLGASPAFSLVKELIGSGKKVKVIMGFNKASEVILLDEYRALGADVTLVTMDGSAGEKGLVTEYLPEGGFDWFYTCGPKVMMKAVCSAVTGPGEASLEERMGCGCGICYGCTCHTTEGPRRVCADGPVFKKEEIIW